MMTSLSLILFSFPMTAAVGGDLIL